MRGRGYERILPFADRTRPVHSFRNLVWRMVRQILAESICEQPAAQLFRPPGQVLHSLKKFLGNRRSYSHTHQYKHALSP